MKVSKSLLGAILVGVAVQAGTSSCTKQNNDVIKPQQEAQASEQPAATNPDPDPGCCPACGMG